MKKWILIGLVVAAGGGGAAWWKMSASAALEEAAAAVETARSELGSIRQSVECTGRVVSNLDVEIKCKASGEITELSPVWCSLCGGQYFECIHGVRYFLATPLDVVNSNT